MTVREILESQINDTEILEESVVLNKGDILRFLNILNEGIDVRKSVHVGILQKKTKPIFKLALESFNKYTKIFNNINKVKGLIFKSKEKHIKKIGVDHKTFTIYIDVFGDDRLEEYKKQFDKAIDDYFKLIQLSANRFRKKSKTDLSSFGEGYEKKFVLDVILYGRPGPDGLMKDESRKLIDYISQTLNEIATV